MTRLTTTLGVILLLTGTGAAHDVEEDDARAVLTIYPSEIRLDHGLDIQRFCVLATTPDGVTRDVTREARLRFSTDGVARIDGRYRVSPVRDGEAALTVTWNGLTKHAKVTVKKASRRAPPSFNRDVIPLFTRIGCNSGGCHGSASGKNGFRLSLFGYDPRADYDRVTRELRGRRVDPALATESLLLKKPAMEVIHKGGKVLEADSDFYDTLRRWIDDGAKWDEPAKPSLQRIEIEPRSLTIAGSERRQRMIVRAFYSDGTDRDVTDLAILSSSNDAAAKIDSRGDLTSTGPGESFVMARFGTFAVVSQVIVVEDRPFAWPSDVRAANYIDESIHSKLLRMRVKPGPVCSDETFVRRVYLDVLNVLPTVEESRAFLADESADKRARLVDELMKRPEFPEVWAMQWAEVLRVESDKLEAKGMHVYTSYLRDAFERGVPMDKLVRDLLGAEGGSFDNPASNFYLTERDPKAIAENVAQVFLGIRIQCAQCHNHPFERWTMDDYYGFAAFFGQIGRKRAEDPREVVIFNRRSGEVRHMVGNRVVPPKHLGGAAAEVPRGGDRRQVLARWMTDDSNPYFATNIANRVFARFMGRGVVDPTDDVRVSNPPSHPDLHAKLGAKLIEYRYDLRRLIRDICNSRTYQLDAQNARLPEGSFAGGPVRRLTAEQLLDGISRVTGAPTKYRGLPLGARAAQVSDGNPRNYFLDVFGRPRRTSACTCERRGEPTLGQSLHLINGSTIASKISDANGRLRRGLESGAEDAAMLEELYLAAYSRRPRPDEVKHILGEIAEAKNRAQAWEDVYWAVLNSKEFVFNH